MLAVLILSLKFSLLFADAMPPNEIGVDSKKDAAMISDCPNTAILLNILNIMTKLLPQDGKNMLEPEKLKHVLTIVKSFLETTPFNADNLDLYNKFKNIEQQLDKINVPINEHGLRENIDENSKASASIQYIPTQRNCHDIFNNLVKLINSAYSQVIRYCAVTEKCYIKNENINPNIYSNPYPFNLNAPLPQNTLPIKPNQKLMGEIKYSPTFGTKLTEPLIASADLINFLKNQESKDINNIMTVFQNYIPSGDVSNAAKDPIKLSNELNPVLPVNPGKELTYNLTPPSIPYVEKLNYDVNGQKHPLKPQLLMQLNNENPNLNTISWQNIFSGLKELSGNTYDQQYVKLLEQKYYGSNNLGFTSSIYPGTDKISYIILNGKIVPIKTPTTKSIQDMKPNLSNYPNFKSNDINTNPNVLNDVMKLFLNNPQQNLLYTNTNFSPIKKLPGVDTKNIKDISNLLHNKTNLENTQLINNLHNFNTDLYKHVDQDIPSNVLKNTLQYDPMMPQQSYLYTYDPLQNKNQNQFLYRHPAFGQNNQLLNAKKLDFNRIYGIPDHNSKQNIDIVNTVSDNKKRGNYENQLLDLNQLLGVANLAKSNSVPNKNGVVELTYVFKKPKPVYDSDYYVKYRLPYQTFVYNLQNLLIKKPHLRNEPNHLYQVLLVGSNVTDTSKDLQGLNYDQIIRLTSTNGTLVTAKILESNDTVLENTLKVVQKLNSNIPLENIINLNATKNMHFDIKADKSNDSQDSNVMKNSSINPQRRGIYQYWNYPLNTLGQYQSRLNYPYSIYQANPTIYTAPLKYGYNVINTNPKPMYVQNVGQSYPQLMNYYGR